MASESPALVTITNPPAAQPFTDGEWIRAFLHLQEQVHQTQLSIERSRMEAEALAARNTEALNNRLRQLEVSLEDARKQNYEVLRRGMDAVQESNRRMLVLAGVFAVGGLLVLAGTAWLQWRTINRMATMPTLAPALGWMPSTGQQAPLPLALAGANAQLLEALGRLEHRISGLEHRDAPNPARGDATSSRASTTFPDGASAPAGNHQPGDELEKLLREGEALLARDEAAKALECYEAVLRLKPAHAEALLHRGTALERLQRLEEAIASYDRAIAADASMTLAYLYKGGLFNRMERFSEAMECYEKALKVQEQRQPA